jgi:hypothetical protein
MGVLLTATATPEENGLQDQSFPILESKSPGCFLSSAEALGDRWAHGDGRNNENNTWGTGGAI